MQVQSLGWEDPLEKEMATHSGILAWGNPMEIPWSLADYSPWGCKKADMKQRDLNHVTQQFRSVLLGAAGLLVFHCQSGEIL